MIAVTAIESALQLRARIGGSVTALSMGPPSAEVILRKALALGVDDAVLLSDRAFGGADTLATIYHSCHREWCEVGGTGSVVRNYISLVAEALGCARRDDFQELKRLGDPAAIAALSRPVWETHGLSETQAKELAAKYFVPKKG